MIKNLKISLVLVLIFLLIPLLGSCKLKPTMGGDANKIIITGLEGKTGQITVTIMSNATDPAVSGTAVITNGKAEIEFKYNNGQPWKDRGSYLILADLNRTVYCYTDGKNRSEIGLQGTETTEQWFKKIPKCRISRGTTTISFNKFIERDALR